MTAVEMSIRISDESLVIMRSLIKKAKRVNCFEYEGYLFQGNLTDTAIEFIYNNPKGGDFFVWLQDNRKIITVLQKDAQ